MFAGEKQDCIEGSTPVATESVSKRMEEKGLRAMLEWQARSNELPNYGAGRGGPPSLFCVSVHSRGDEVEWNQHLHKC